MQIRGRRQGMGKLSCKFFQFTKLSETSEQHPANSSCKSCLFSYAFRLTNEDFIMQEDEKYMYKKVINEFKKFKNK